MKKILISRSGILTVACLTALVLGGVYVLMAPTSVDALPYPEECSWNQSQFTTYYSAYPYLNAIGGRFTSCTGQWSSWGASSGYKTISCGSCSSL